MMHNLKNLLDALYWLSDYDYQRTSWFPNSLNRQASYNENVMWLFDDTGLEAALKAGNIVFSEEIDDAFRDLLASTQEIDGDNFSEEELIDHPKMYQIRDKAAAILIMLESSIR